MSLNRRQALALAAATGLAGCGRHRLVAGPRSRPLDTRLLDREFPAIAQRAQPGAFAAGVMDLATTETWYWNTNRAFPLAEAAAAPIAAAALAQVDAHKLSLTDRVSFDSLDLSPPPSVIDRDWPSTPANPTASIPVATLFSLALHGDDTALDILTKRIGGPGAVGAFLQAKGVTGLRIDRYQREIGVDLFGMPTFRAAWRDKAAFDAARNQVQPTQRQAAMDHYILDPRDAATVPAALGFLAMLADGELLSPASTAKLLGWMSGPKGPRFGAGLPGAASLARAFGASRTDLGFTAATAELAIATFPTGRRYAMAGFLVGSTATPAARNVLFADTARLLTRAVT